MLSFFKATEVNVHQKQPHELMTFSQEKPESVGHFHNNGQFSYTTPGNKPIAQREYTVLSTATATKTQPVNIPNVPHVYNSCFISASLQFFAAFLSKADLSEIRTMEIPQISSEGQDTIAFNTRKRLAAEAGKGLRDLFYKIVRSLKCNNGVVTKQEANDFVGCMKAYILLTKNIYAELYFPNGVCSQENLDLKLPSFKNSDLATFINYIGVKLEQQDATEFIALMRNILKLDTLSSVTEASQIQYVRTTGIDLGNNVLMKQEKVEEPDLFFNFVFSPGIHTRLAGCDFSDVMSYLLLNEDTRDLKVDMKTATSFYQQAGKELPPDYDENRSHLCHVATHLRVNPGFHRLLVTLGIFGLDKSGRYGRLEKRQEEVKSLISTTEGYVSLTDIIEYKYTASSVSQNKTLPTECKEGEITAILCHLGESPHGGHYITLRKIRGQWYFFDDRQAKPGILLEKFLEELEEDELPSVKHTDLSGFNGVAHLVQQGATPYVLAIDIKRVKPITVSPAKRTLSERETTLCVNAKRTTSPQTDIPKQQEEEEPTSRRAKVTLSTMTTVSEPVGEDDDCIITCVIPGRTPRKNTHRRPPTRKKTRRT